ncbi:INPP phosphatase, partial [Nothoprocta ornata]|nr:INPP phosphatase [Nothoprocta pentlandii]NWY07857.1 INPP phosphatase [Nothoprocta ornata]
RLRALPRPGQPRPPPADSTNEYIRGHEDVAPEDGIYPSGLRSALVLVGAYERRSGCPVLGVINEPFFRRDPLTQRYQHGQPRAGGSGSRRAERPRCPRRWHGRYHWGISWGEERLCSLRP